MDDPNELNEKKEKSLKGELDPKKVIAIEKCMIQNNLKLTKSDISLAARNTKIPINKALRHFHTLNKKLSNDKTKKNKKLTKIISELYKRIEKIRERIKVKETSTKSRKQ